MFLFLKVVFVLVTMVGKLADPQIKNKSQLKHIAGNILIKEN